MPTQKFFANPYVNFQGKARDAMQFYQKILGGKLDLLAMDSSGKIHPAAPDEKIMHSRLLADGAIIMGTDGSPDYPATRGDNIAISLTGSDKEQMTKIYNQLAEGGDSKMPLSDSSWGDLFGYLQDKFGINWMLVVTKPENMTMD